jgi:hypothetical protein
MSDTSGLPNPDADHGDDDGAEPPPADFDPAEQPSNPDLVGDPESPDE